MLLEWTDTTFYFTLAPTLYLFVSTWLGLKCRLDLFNESFLLNFFKGNYSKKWTVRNSENSSYYKKIVLYINNFEKIKNCLNNNIFINLFFKMYQFLKRNILANFRKIGIIHFNILIFFCLFGPFHEVVGWGCPLSGFWKPYFLRNIFLFFPFILH